MGHLVSYNALAAGDKLHFARRIVYVAVRRAGGTVFRSTFTVYRTRLTNGTGVAAGTNMCQRYSRCADTACLYA